MRDRAQTVIVGAGIVGASAAYHLAELGATDVLVIDQGPLFETGGSTSHAPGLVFQTNGSRTMCRIAQDTVRLYDSLELDGEPCWYGVGGIEIATTPERMAELRRRQGFARSYGIDDTALLTPAETAERIPLLDPSAILGAYLVPSDGIAKAVRIVTALAAKASERGVAFEGGVTVTGFDIRDGRVHGVETDRGRIECERVLICAGIWGPTVGALAGVPVPLVAVQHQLVWTDPIPELAGETREVVHPILRHQDHAMYFRHREDHYGVGNYRHEPIVTPQRDIRRHGDGPMPSLMPFTPGGLRVGRARDRTRAPRARRSHAARRPRTVDQRDVLVHAGRRLHRRRVRERPRPLALRGGVGHARRRHGTAGRRVDGERRARLRPGRGGREPVLPVPDDAAVRAGAGRAAVPRGVRHPAPAPADDRAAQAAADAVLRPPRGARRGVLHRRGLGAPAVVRGEPRAADRRRLGAPRRVGRDELVARRRRRAPRHPRARGAVRHHAVRQVRRGRAGRARRTSSGSARTGSTVPSARSSTRRCSRRPAGSAATSR